MIHVTRMGPLLLAVLCWMVCAIPLSAQFVDQPCSAIFRSAVYVLDENDATEVTSITTEDGVFSGYIRVWEDHVNGTLSDYVKCTGPDEIEFTSDGAVNFQLPDCTFGNGCVDAIENDFPTEVQVCDLGELLCNKFRIYSEINETEGPEPTSVLLVGSGLLLLLLRKVRIRRT